MGGSFSGSNVVARNGSNVAGRNPTAPPSNLLLPLPAEFFESRRVLEGFDSSASGGS